MLPTILLTNDDGIDSPGLAAAAVALVSLGRLVIAAPLHQQTSMGRSYAGKPDAKLVPHSFFVNGQKVDAYSYEGSPAAVVRHALLGLPRLSPALVVAGINYGENIGFNVTGSGTVGATLEAASRGIPALAMSVETSVEAHREYAEQDWEGSIHFTRFFADRILRKGMPMGATVLKVEVPACATADTPWKPTRLSPFTYYECGFEKPSAETVRSDMRFRKRDGIGEPTDTDAYAIRTAKTVSVTPMQLDLTASTPFPLLTAWADG